MAKDNQTTTRRNLQRLAETYKRTIVDLREAQLEVCTTADEATQLDVSASIIALQHAFVRLGPYITSLDKQEQPHAQHRP